MNASLPADIFEAMHELLHLFRSRMREDMVFAPGPAQRDFGYAPRAFKPEARMFESRNGDGGT